MPCPAAVNTLVNQWSGIFLKHKFDLLLITYFKRNTFIRCWLFRSVSALPILSILSSRLEASYPASSRAAPPALPYILASLSSAAGRGHSESPQDFVQAVMSILTPYAEICEFLCLSLVSVVLECQEDELLSHCCRYPLVCLLLTSPSFLGGTDHLTPTPTLFLWFYVAALLNPQPRWYRTLVQDGPRTIFPDILELKDSKSKREREQGKESKLLMPGWWDVKFRIWQPYSEEWPQVKRNLVSSGRHDLLMYIAKRR